jgi:hypothetical protein
MWDIPTFHGRYGKLHIARLCPQNGKLGIFLNFLPTIDGT